MELQLQPQSFNEYSELSSFRIGRFDFFAVQGTLKSLLKHHNSKAQILCASRLMVQVSHSYMTTGTIITLTIQTFVDKVMFLLFTMLSRFVIAFLPKMGQNLLYMTLQSHSLPLSAEAVTTTEGSLYSVLYVFILGPYTCVP